MSSDSDESGPDDARSSEENQRLPSEVEDMIGQATNALIFQEFDRAISILQQVIMKAPKLPDPLHRLGVIYEEKGDICRSANYYYMAALLTKKNPSELWRKAALLYKQDGKIKEAIYCYKRDLMKKFDPEILKERAHCFQEVGENKKAIKDLNTILRVTYDKEVLTGLVQLYNQINQPNNAIEALKTQLRQDYDPDLLNLLCELLIKTQEYADWIEFIDSLSITGNLPLEIAMRYGQCKLRVGDLVAADLMFERVYTRPVRHYPDLFQEIASDYEDVKEYDKALKYLETLREVQDQNKPDLWLRCGSLYSAIGDYVSAETAFNEVMIADENLAGKAKMYLAHMLKESGDYERSEELLKDLEGYCLSDDQSLQFAQLKLDQAQIYKLNQESEKCLEATESCIDAIVENSDKLDKDILNSLPDIEEIVKETCDFLQSQNQSERSCKIAEKVLMIPGVDKTYWKKQVILSSIAIKDYEKALKSCAYLCETDQSAGWLVTSYVLSKHMKPDRNWLVRLSSKGVPEAIMLLANSYLQTGYFSNAIKHYSSLRDSPDAKNSTLPIINFCIGLCHLHAASSRTSKEKEDSIEKALLYFQRYKLFSKNKLENSYNMGRAFHQISYLSTATKYYNKVLQLWSKEMLHKSEYKKGPEYMKLSAYNLMQIYRTNGELELARQVVLDYL